MYCYPLIIEMVKTIINRLITILFLFLVTFSCTREPEEIYEPYKHLTGTYLCDYVEYSYGQVEGYRIEDIRIVKVRPFPDKQSIYVLNRKVTLNEHGVFTDYHYYLKFWNDSIYSNHMNGGLGGGKYQIYTGVKISSDY